MDGKRHRKLRTSRAPAGLVSTDDMQGPWRRIADGLGGASGGSVGAQVPDWIESALHAWRRDVGHSYTTTRSSLPEFRAP